MNKKDHLEKISENIMFEELSSDNRSNWFAMERNY